VAQRWAQAASNLGSDEALDPEAPGQDLRQ